MAKYLDKNGLQYFYTLLKTEYEGCITPEMFGAKGDGVTDDTQALNSCFSCKKAVYLSKTYLVSGTLNYAGESLFGNGEIVVSSFPDTDFAVVECNCGNISISGITIDGNGGACIGIHINSTGSVSISNVKISDLNNTYYSSNYSTSGIYVDSCVTATVENNVVSDVNRTKGVDGTHSSTGISVFASGEICVKGNDIKNIKSTTGSSECDGVYVGSVDNNDINNTAIIENNVITDSTGRFIKSQVRFTVVRNNRCAITFTYSPTRYMQGVSIQRGSFEIVNNYFYLKDSVHRQYTRVINLEVYDSHPRTGIISGNTVISDSSSSTDVKIRSYFNVSSTSQENTINIDISNNIFAGKSEGIVGISSSYLVNGIVKIHHNITNAYQAFDLSNSSSDGKSLTGIICDVRFNNNRLYSGSSRFSDETVPIKNVIYRYNYYLNEAINNYPLSFNDLSASMFVGYYRGSIQAMTDVPSAIARGDYLFLDKSPTITEFYNGANTNSGYIIH